MTIPQFLSEYQNGHVPLSPDYDDIACTDVIPAEHMNGTHGEYATVPDARFQTWKQEQPRPSWRDREPKHVHSLKWIDADRIEHLHVFRSDNLDEVLKEMATVKAVIRAAKAKAEPQAVAVTTTAQGSPPATPEQREDYCFIHDCPMQQRHGKHGPWHQHTLPSGEVCKGKAPCGGRSHG